MQRQCKTCGTVLDEEIFICPVCGSLPDSHADEPTKMDIQPETSTPPVEMTFGPVKKKFPKWIFGVGIAAILVIALAFSWKALLMLIAPKAALSLAITNTTQVLEQRYANSPAAVLAQGTKYLQDGTFSIDTDVTYEGEHVQAKVDFSHNKEKKQTAAGAAITFREKNYNANFYLDPEFAAINADFFQDGTYYGITFASFQEDIRKSILGQELSDEDIQEIDNLIQAFVDIYTLDIDKDDLIKPYTQIIKKYVMELDATRGEDTIFIDSQQYSCTTLTYSLSEEDIRDLIDSLMDTLEDDDELRALICRSTITPVVGSNIEPAYDELLSNMEEAIEEAFAEADFTLDVVFFVRNNHVISMKLTTNIEANGEEAEISIDIDFGLKAKNNISMKLTAEVDGETASMKLVSKVTDDSTSFKETIEATLAMPQEEEQNCTYTTKWNKSSGKLTLNVKAKVDGETNEFSFVCNLIKENGGFYLTLDQNQVNDLLLQLDEDPLPEGLEFRITIGCTKGANIAKPQYVNLDQLDDAWLQQLQETLIEFTK